MEQNQTNQILREFTEEVKLGLDIIQSHEVEQVITKLRGLRNNSLIDVANIYIIGNGGSASTASHFAVDLNMVNAEKEYRYFTQAYALTDVSAITAYGNDYSFENCFSKQLQHINKWDAVIGISVSGKSENVIEGCRIAKEKGASTLALTKKDSKLAYIVESAILFPDQESLDLKYFYVMESVQLAVCHAIVAALAGAIDRYTK